MKKSILLIIASALILAISLSGCGNSGVQDAAPTATETAMPTNTITATPDLCAPENIRAHVDKVHRHMREFDDAATLAASMPREQLSEPISDLQRIRREAEDELVPSCLSALKDYQVNHMNSVISTLIAFMGINDPLAVDCVDVVENTQEAAICHSIAMARQLHDQYTLELARILGIPIVTATVTITTLETPTP
jgi:hypothetical protein